MRIAFEKSIDGHDKLTCQRRNGTVLVEYLEPGSIYHDVSHFVVETFLGLNEGIWGMIENGATLSQYNLPNEERPFQITPEGYKAEFLATLVQSAIPHGRIDKAYIALLQKESESAGIPFPELPNRDALKQMVVVAQVLMKQWERSQPGNVMRLDF